MNIQAGSADLRKRHWTMLMVYNVYRLSMICIFLVLILSSAAHYEILGVQLGLTAIYAVIAIVFLYFCYFRKINFELQVLLSGVIDIIMMAVILSMLVFLSTGIGFVLYITIAALSILAPGRLALFFAALASCVMLLAALLQYLFDVDSNLGIFFYSGVYASGFFATAITAWYLANWVRTSEELARQHSEELANFQRINEYIVERLYSGVIYADKDGQIKLINHAARDFLQLDAATDYQHLQEISPALNEKCHLFLSQQGQGEQFGRSYLEEPNLKVLFFATVLGNRPAILITLEDMTSINEQAQQLKLASLGRLSASIAHELRNPLASIAHAAELLGDGQPLSSEDQHFKAMIIKNCQRMNGVIKNVLQLSRREKARPEAVDLKLFINTILQHFSHHQNCIFNVELSKQPLPAIYFDKSQLEQIFIALIENALQHGRKGEAPVKIDISYLATKKEIELRISDNGPGIKKEIEKIIFDPFFSSQPSGTGMGLFIARDLCEINQARLVLRNSDEGGCFAIIINKTQELIV